MKVGKLKEMLKDFNDNDNVILSVDAEGNEYKKLEYIAKFEGKDVAILYPSDEVYSVDEWMVRNHNMKKNYKDVELDYIDGDTAHFSIKDENESNK